MNNKQPYEQSTTRDSEKLKKQKKAIIITAICLTGFILLYFVISAIDWSGLFANNGRDDNNGDNGIYFYDESLSYDLSTDDIYMGYDRTINLKNESTGITNTITDKDIASHGEAVSLLYNFIEYMISGNVEAYNSCFSQTYYKNNSPKNYFTKQKLYSITIIDVSSTEKRDENGKFYNEYYFALDYKIRHNNGSLRGDVESDAIKRQHIILTDKSGEILIDYLYTINYIDKNS
jgi:hypothetical protein